MKQLLSILTILLFLILVSNCKKEEQITQSFTRDTVFTGNKPPDYIGVPTVLVENYINKLNIDLIGEELSDNDLSSTVSYLRANNLNDLSRDSIVRRLTNTLDYYYRLYDLEKSKMLKGVDSSTIVSQIELYEYIKSTLDSTQTQLAQDYTDEINKFNNLLTAPDDYYNGTITLNSFYQRLLENAIYDEINMGSENFVHSAFENLLFRLPTVSELSDGIKMVDGEPSQLFLTSGNSKGDFVDILTASDAFYEGLVTDGYLRFLVRNPSSTEMYAETDSVKTKNDQAYLHKLILKKDEYAGF